MNELQEGIDYTISKDGLFVFTREYHLKRGYCCGSNCLNCPYAFGMVRRGADHDSTKTDSPNRTDS